jgi:hypothetical protein
MARPFGRDLVATPFGRDLIARPLGMDFWQCIFAGISRCPILAAISGRGLFGRHLVACRSLPLIQIFWHGTSGRDHMVEISRQKFLGSVVIAGFSLVMIS